MRMGKVVAKHLWSSITFFVSVTFSHFGHFFQIFIANILLAVALVKRSNCIQSTMLPKLNYLCVVLSCRGENLICDHNHLKKMYPAVRNFVKIEKLFEL